MRCTEALYIDVIRNNVLSLCQPCHVIYTDYRPTPLQHYIFPAGGDGLHLVVDENVRIYFYFYDVVYFGIWDVNRIQMSIQS